MDWFNQLARGGARIDSRPQGCDFLGHHFQNSDLLGYNSLGYGSVLSERGTSLPCSHRQRIALLWACVGEIDIVAVGQGKIVPSGRTKVIQAFETGEESGKNRGRTPIFRRGCYDERQRKSHSDPDSYSSTLTPILTLTPIHTANQVKSENAGCK